MNNLGRTGVLPLLLSALILNAQEPVDEASIAKMRVEALEHSQIMRTLHFLTFALYILSITHGVTNGTDTKQLWMLCLYGLTGALAAMTLIYRMTPASGAQDRRTELERPSG